MGGWQFCGGRDFTTEEKESMIGAPRATAKFDRRYCAGLLYPPTRPSGLILLLLQTELEVLRYRFLLDPDSDLQKADNLIRDLDPLP